MTDTWRPKLLLIDDSADTVALVERTAADAGFDVTTSASYREALDQAVDLRPDVTLADLEMTRDDPRDILRAIHAAQPECHVGLLAPQACDEAAIEAVAAIADSSR